MGMLYERGNNENLFVSGTLVNINAEYLSESFDPMVKGSYLKKCHKVKIRWYPDGIDRSCKKKVITSDNISGVLNPGSIVKVRVEYISYHRKDYHIICIEGEDMLIHKSLFNINNVIEPNLTYLSEDAA